MFERGRIGLSKLKKARGNKGRARVRTNRQVFVTFLPKTLLRSYRTIVSPVLGQNCRFYPTCSSYAEQALERYGLIRGSWLGLQRVLRCHPWNPGGHDPVV